MKILLLLLLTTSIYSQDSLYIKGFQSGFDMGYKKALEDANKKEIPKKQNNKLKELSIKKGITDANNQGKTDGVCLGLGLGCIGVGVGAVYEPNPPMNTKTNIITSDYEKAYKNRKKSLNLQGSFIGVGVLTVISLLVIAY